MKNIFYLILLLSSLNTMGVRPKEIPNTEASLKNLSFSIRKILNFFDIEEDSNIFFVKENVTNDQLIELAPDIIKLKEYHFVKRDGKKIDFYWLLLNQSFDKLFI